MGRVSGTAEGAYGRERITARRELRGVFERHGNAASLRSRRGRAVVQKRIQQMNLDKLEDLKRQIAEAPDFKDPFNYFLDHFGDREEFHDIGERTSHPKLEQMLEVCAATLAGPRPRVEQLPHRSRSPAIVPARHLPRQRKGGQLHLLRRRSARSAGDPARESRRCDADHAFHRAGPSARLAAVGELTRRKAGRLTTAARTVGSARNRIFGWELTRPDGQTGVDRTIFGQVRAKTTRWKDRTDSSRFGQKPPIGRVEQGPSSTLPVLKNYGKWVKGGSFKSVDNSPKCA